MKPNKPYAKLRKPKAIKWCVRKTSLLNDPKKPTNNPATGPKKAAAIEMIINAGSICIVK